MLTSMSLVRIGLRLSKEAYTQGTLTLRRTRKRLAEHVWAMEVNSKDTRWSSQGTSTATCNEASLAGRDPGLRGHPQKRKQGTEGRLALGNTALRRRWWGSKTGQPSRNEGVQQLFLANLIPCKVCWRLTRVAKNLQYCYLRAVGRETERGAETTNKQEADLLLRRDRHGAADVVLRPGGPTSSRAGQRPRPP